MDVLRVMDTHCSSHIARKHFRTLRITLQVVSFLVFNAFSGQKSTPDTFCALVCTP